MRDRHSRSGLGKPSENSRKAGAGAHNWGSFRQEGEHEVAAGADASFEMEGDDLGLQMGSEEARGPPTAEVDMGNKADVSTSPSESMSSVDSVGGQDSPAKVGGGGGGGGGRRMSGVSDYERERARVFREGALHKGGEWHYSCCEREMFGMLTCVHSFSVLRLVLYQYSITQTALFLV